MGDLSGGVPIPRPKVTRCFWQIYNEAVQLYYIAPPLAGPTPRMIPVNPISLCENFIIVLHTIVVIFSDLYSISICQLNRWIALLYTCQKHRITYGGSIRTPRLRDHIWFGLGQWGAPLVRPPLAGPTLRMIPVIPISLDYCVAYYYVYFQWP